MALVRLMFAFTLDRWFAFVKQTDITYLVKNVKGVEGLCNAFC